MRLAEQKCRKFFTGLVSFSPKTNVSGAVVCFLKAALKYKKGDKVSSRLLQKYQHNADLLGFQWKNFSIAFLNDLLQQKERDYEINKKHSPQNRRGFLERLAEDNSKILNQKKERIYKMLINRELMRRSSNRIKKVTAKPRAGSLLCLIAPHPITQEREECLSEHDIVAACLAENKKKYLQSYDTPCLMEPLISALGLKGDGPAVDDILNGQFNCPDVSPTTQAFLRELASPQQPTPSPEYSRISEQNNIDDLKKTQEKTSSSPSKLHYGLWKTNSLDPTLNSIDTIFRDITFRHGLTLTRWYKALDIELLKEPGNYNIERLRTIVLFEGDHQLNSKRLGKRAIHLADSPENTLIAAEQYGCRKHHRAIEVVLNSRLVDDILRIERRPAIICSNDAKSCFDRIVHSIFALCL